MFCFLVGSFHHFSSLTDIQGEGINFANIQKSPVYPIVYGKSAKKKDADVNDSRCRIVE